MRNKHFEKRKLAYRYDCNEWCCPCNDGKTGCFADDLSMDLCDFHKLETLRNLIYDVYLEALKTKDYSTYEDICDYFFKMTDIFYEQCPAYYKGYCSEKGTGCLNSDGGCPTKLELLEASK